MAVSIDERVVEMRFNNKQFEEGVRQSMKSLDNLDQSIDNLDNKSLNNLVEKLNKINFDSLERGMDSLEKRFSAFGVAGMTVIQDLVHGIEGLGAKLLSVVTKPLNIMKNGGWARAMNIENAKFQIEGLGLSFEQLESSISKAVDGTAYGFDAAAKAAGQLSASGVKAGKDMDDALRAISGVAAMTNKGYEEISPIFTAVAGQGKAMAMQMNQLALKGVNAYSTLAKYLGKTEAQVREMVSDGKVNFKIFAEAMNDAFGEHATKANETYEGSLANMQARLKQIGQIVATEWIHGMIGVHNAIRNLLTVVKEELIPILQNKVNPVIHDVLAVATAVINKIGQSDKFRDVVRNIGNGIAKVAKAVQKLFFRALLRLDPIINDLYDIGKAIQIIYKNITGSEKELRPTVILIKALDFVLNGILTIIQGIVTGIKLITLTLADSGIGEVIKKYVLPLGKIILPLIAAWLLITKLHLLKIVAVVGAVTAAIAAINKFQIVDKVITLSKAIRTLASNWLKKLYDKGLDIIGVIEKIKEFDLKGAIDDLKSSITSFFTNLTSGAKTTESTFKTTFSSPLELLKDLIENLQNADGAIGTTRDTLFGLFSKVKEEGSSIIGFIEGFAKGVANIKPEFLIVGTMGLVIMSTFANLSKAIIKVTTALNTMTEAFKSLTAIPTQITGSLKEIADSYLLMAKADMRRSTIGLIIAFAGSLVVLATAIAIISKVVYPEDFVKIAALIAGLGMIIGGVVGLILYLHHKLNPLQQAAEETMATGTAIVNAVKSFGKEIAKSMAIKAIGSVLKSLAILIISLTGSLIMLHQYIPDTRYLSDIVGALTTFVGVIGVIIATVALVSRNSASSAGAVLGFAATFVSIAGAMFLMVNALQKYKELNMDSKELANVLYAVGATALLMIGTSALMARAFSGVTASILSLIASTLALVVVLKAAPDFVRAFGEALSSIAESFKNLTDLQQETFIEIIGLISGLIIAGMAVSRMATHGMRVIMTVTGVIAGLVAMLKVLEVIGRDKTVIENIKGAFDELKDVLGGVSVCLGILFATAGAAKHAGRAALLLLALPISLLGFIGEMKLLLAVIDGVKPKKLSLLVSIFVELGLILSLVLLCSRDAGNAWGSILSLTTVLISLTFMIGSLALLYEAAPQSLTAGAVATVTALLGLSAILSQLKNMTKKKLATGTILIILLGLAACIAAVGAVVTSIIYFGEDYRWGEIAAIFGGLTLVLFGLGAIATAMYNLAREMKSKQIKLGDLMKPMVAMLAGVAALFGVAASLMVVVKNTSVDDIPMLIVATGAMYLLLYGVMAVVERLLCFNLPKVKMAMKIGAALAIASLSLVAIAGSLWLLKDINWPQLLGSAASMVLVFGALALALGIISKLAPDGETVLMVAAGLTMLSISMIALAGAIRILATAADPNAIEAAAWAIGGLVVAISAGLAILALVPGVAELILPVAAAVVLSVISASVAAVAFAAAITLVMWRLEKFLGFLVQNKDTIEDALANFGKGLLKFVKKLGKSIIKLFVSVAEAFVETFITLLDGLFRVLQTFNTDVLTTAQKFIVDLGKLIAEGATELGISIYTGMTTFAAYLKKGVDDVKKILGKDSNILGAFFSQGISFGMLDGVGLVSKAAMTVARAAIVASAEGFDEHSPSLIGFQQGFFFNLGIAHGLGEDKPVQTAAKMTASDAVSTFAENLIGKETVDAGKEMINNVIEGGKDFLNGSGEDKLKKLGEWFGNIFTGSAGDSINSLMDSLGLYMNHVSAEDKAKYQAQAVKNIQDKIKLNDLYRRGLEQEAAAMGNIGNNYKAVPIEQTKTYLRDVENEYKRLIKNHKGKGFFEGIIDDVKNAADEAAENLDPSNLFGDALGGLGDDADDTATKLDNLKDSIASATSGFGAFNREVTVTTKGVMKDLKSQIVGVSEYMEAIKVLAARGFSKDVIEALNDLGAEQGYQYASALLDATKKEVPKINKMFAKKGKLSKLSQKEIEKWYTKSGKSVSKAWIKGAKDDKAWKEFSIGEKGTTLTGKALKKALKKALSKLDMSEILKNDKSNALSKALNTYLEASTSKSKKATSAFQDYLTKAYLATLSETEMQEALNKSQKALAKDVAKYWETQSQAVHQSVQDQIRSMEDLSKAGTMTGEEYIKKLKKQQTDYNEYIADKRQMLLAASLAGATDETMEYIRNTATIDEILAFTDLASKNGAEKAGKMWVKNFESGIASGTSDEISFDALLDTGSVKEKRKELKAISDMTSKSVSAEEKYAEALKGIRDQSNGLAKTDKKITKIAQHISESFTLIGSSAGVTAFDAASSAIENYALSMLDYDAILQEVSITGADVADVISEQLKDMSANIQEFRDNIASSLKSALQSFDKFDEGEKKSFEDMTKNLESNVTKLNEWRAMMKKMQQMGYSKDIIEYMASQGINSYAEVAAMTAAGITSAQIDHVNQMWEQVGEQSETGADEAFGSVAIAAGTAGRDTVDGVIAEVEDEISKQNAEVSKSINDAGSEATKAIKNQEEPIKNQATMSIKTIGDAVLNNIDVFIKNPLMAKIASTVKDAAVAVVGKENAYKMAMNYVGKNSVLGLVDGMTGGMVSKVVQAGVGLGNAAQLGAKKSLGVASPSKVFKWIGEQTVEGLALGFSNNAYRATDEVDELSNSLIAYAQRLSDDLANTLPTEDEWTIKPVLDLDELQNAHSLINSMLGNGDIAVRSSTLAGQTATQSEWSMLSKALSGVSGETTNNTYGDTQIIINPPQGSNSREIAQMVMGEIQRQMDRRQRI